MARNKSKVAVTAADELMEGVLNKEEHLIEFIREKRESALSYLLIGVGLVAMVAGGYHVVRQRSAAASTLLAEVLDNYHGKVMAGTAEVTPKPGEITFKSDAERLAAAEKSINALLGKYPLTSAAVKARLLKVALLAEMGKTEEALTLATSLSSSGDTTIAAQALNAQAELAIAAGKTDQAISALKAAIKLNSPAFPVAAARLTLADQYLAKGETEKARAELKLVQDAKDSGSYQAKATEKMTSLPPAPAETAPAAPVSAAH